MVKHIPLSSPDINLNDKMEVLKVLSTRHLTQGPKINEFEKKFSEYLEVPYAIAVNSGTSALHLAVRSLGLQMGDEVIVTPFSFIASSNCLLMEKIKPVFVDINEKDFNIDPELIEEKITKKTKAILPVDIFGNPIKIKEIKILSEKYSLPILEDSCEALGAEYSGAKVGTLSDIATFGFYPNKQITTGEGGMIVTFNKNLAELCISMRNQGRNINGDWFFYERLGYNYRMNEMSAALGSAQMNRIEEILSKRKKVANIYLKKLKDLEGIILPYNDENKSWFNFVIRVDEKIRNNLLKYLQTEGIECKNYFPSIHLEPFYMKEFGYKKGDFPISEKISSQTIALPFYNLLKEEDISYIKDKLEKGIKNA
ncbi:MAG: DegT/DnrJ/EryC1/StrS family aminotransferase [Candidatus Pacearchaeota archaeon]|jgi:perosamine synthetase